MAKFNNYDPGRIIVTFKGAQIQGYADGTFVKWSRRVETFKDSAGAGGDVVRVRSRDKRGTVVITLQAASSSNDVLQAFADADEATGLGYGTLMIKDANGTTLIVAEKAWVEKLPDGEYATDASNREWTIACAELVIKNGGSLV